MTQNVATEGNNAMSKDLEALLAEMAEATETEAAEADMGADEAALLAQLDSIVAPEVEAKPEVDPVTADSELGDDDLTALEMTETRAAVYQSQGAETGVAIADPGTAVQTGKAKKASAGASTGRPRVVRDLNGLPAEVFIRTIGADADAEKAAVLADKPKQVKVVEKWENLFLSINSGAAPSKFTVTAFTLLKQKGSMNTTDLVTAMLAEGLKNGTARSQTGQMLALFAHVGIADRSGQTLTLRADSALAEKLTTILGL